MLEQCFICVTCGAQHAPSAEPPERCAICEDERQYVRHEGQAWTTHDALRREQRCRVEIMEERLTAMTTEPLFAIGQRAHFLGTDEGHVLWDCLPVLDEAVYQMIRSSGGLEAIAISHPHFYTGMIEWSAAFDDAPIYLHADDRAWVQRPDPRIRFWQDATIELPGGLTMIRCGGHFPGASVLHWPDGADGRGALLSGDTISIVPRAGQVTFMYSYPNLLPLSATAVRQIAEAVAPYSFDRLYDAFEQPLRTGAKAAVRDSARLYQRLLNTEAVST